ncbi:hypothetical protein BGX23_000601 [Mortierella sp. AD031]|nr:hypothetical protein BGX23_000601 [Mortierella sp. AD031]
MRFQSQHGHTSLTALFMFLVTAVSFVMAIGYMVLAWYTRTPQGAAHLQRGRDLLGLASDYMDSTAKSTTLLWRAVLVIRRVLRVGSFLVSPLPRLCILIGLVVATFLAGMMQWYKIRNGINCVAVAKEFRHFCSTTKAAVTATFVAMIVWMVWSGLWFRRSFSVSRDGWKMNLQQRRRQYEGGGGARGQQQQSGLREEILIAMPDEVAHGTGMKQEEAVAESHVSRVADTSQPISHTSRSAQLEPHLQYLQTNQTPHDKSLLQQQQKQKPKKTLISGTALDGKDSSLGLRIDICTKSFVNDEGLLALTIGITGDNGAGTSSNSHHSSGSHSRPDLTTTPAFESGVLNVPVRSKSVTDVETASIVGKSATTIARDSIFERKQPQPGRLRDHAKIFSLARGSVGSNLQDARGIGTSYRGTPIPVIYAAGSPALLAMGSDGSGVLMSSPSISGAITPTTPRSRIGYMGNRTIKALNNVPRSVSMGAFAVRNNMSVSSCSSTHASPVPYNQFGGGDYNNIAVAGTPNSLKSYRSMSSFPYPQSPADATAAEQSMDEQLKAIRRPSFASEVMNSPGGSTTLLESAQMNSPSLMMMTPPGELGGSSSRMGSPSSILSKGKGKFRAAFSSPNLNNYRRRSSLGMSSMINSIVNSPTGSESSSSSSSSSPYASPTESITPRSADCSSRRGSDLSSSSNSDDDGQSSLYLNGSSRKRPQQAVSAQDLLRSEYGELYPTLPCSELVLNEM